MTLRQVYQFNLLYLILLAFVAVVTRATARRIAGALAGAGVAGIVAIGIVALGEAMKWWHMTITWKPYFLLNLWIDFTLSGFTFLITWRIARRHGWRGLAVVAVVAALLGPVRDYRYMAMYPEWGYYAPGFAPVVAVSVTYVLLGTVGHLVMRLIAGPAGEDRLARAPGVGQT